MQKIIVAESDIRQALEGTGCPRHVKAAIWHEQRSGYLDVMVQTIIESGLSQDVPGAIKILSQLSGGSLNGKISLSDLQNISNNNSLYKKLDKVQGKERVSNKVDHSRVFGIRSHVTIPELFSGKLVRFEKATIENMPKQGAFPFEEQLPLFTQAKKLHTDRKMEKIESLWHKLTKLMDTDLFPAHSSAYQQLIGLLQPIFGEGLGEVITLGKKSDQHGYLAMLTVLSWVPALLHFYQIKEPLILFKEVSLLPYEYDVGLGRIDALAVRTINGHPPNAEESKLLKRLAYQKFKSVGHLIQRLVQMFGKDLHLVIYDWKFAAGDGDNGVGKTLNLIHTDQVVSEPILKHKRQMERYNATALISYAMVVGNDKNLEELWKTSDFSIEGEIHYFLPTEKKPLIYTINLDEKERKSVFREQVVANYANAEFRSKWMSVSKELLRFTVDLANKKAVTIQSKPSQLHLSLSVETKGQVSRLIRDHMERVYADEYKIIEQVGADKHNRPMYKMHVDRLLEEMNKGNIKPDRFSHLRGGSISCFVHHERTGSMHLNFRKGIFKCFGCGIGGGFLAESIPENMADIISDMPRRSFQRLNGETEKFFVPERHKEAMKAAQHILQIQLLGGPGAVYLEEKRALNPELSWSIGAGFGDEKLIPYLLDQGFTYQEVIDFGFIGFSDAVKETSHLVQALRERGLTIDDVQRAYEKTAHGKDVTVLGLPYSILNNRVTYPLDIDGIITSFYGRAIDDSVGKRLLHRKTKCENVPQGGFNITKAMKQAEKIARSDHSNAPVMGITESPIDVDTFLQRGDLRAFGGMVGTSNNLLYEILSRFDGSIIIAFDNDTSKIVEGKETGLSGQRMTVKFAETLKLMGFEKQVYDFTEPFALKHPDYKDINKFWKEQWGQFLEGNKNIMSHINVRHTTKRIL